MGRCLLDSCGSVYGPLAVSYEQGKETSVFIKYSRTYMDAGYPDRLGLWRGRGRVNLSIILQN